MQGGHSLAVVIFLKCPPCYSAWLGRFYKNIPGGVEGSSRHTAVHYLCRHLPSYGKKPRAGPDRAGPDTDLPGAQRWDAAAETQQTTFFNACVNTAYACFVRQVFSKEMFKRAKLQALLLENPGNVVSVSLFFLFSPKNTRRNDRTSPSRLEGNNALFWSAFDLQRFTLKAVPLGKCTGS